MPIPPYGASQRAFIVLTATITVSTFFAFSSYSSPGAAIASPDQSLLPDPDDDETWTEPPLERAKPFSCVSQGRVFRAAGFPGFPDHFGVFLVHEDEYDCSEVDVVIRCPGSNPVKLNAAPGTFLLPIVDFDAEAKTCAMAVAEYEAVALGNNRYQPTHVNTWTWAAWLGGNTVFSKSANGQASDRALWPHRIGPVPEFDPAAPRFKLFGLVDWTLYPFTLTSVPGLRPPGDGNYVFTLEVEGEGLALTSPNKLDDGYLSDAQLVAAYDAILAQSEDGGDQ